MKIHLVDATRMSDGRLVYIKRVKTGDLESNIAIMLNEERYRQDSRNHSVPILDTFADDQDPSVSYMVMPFLREIDWPEFETVAEVVDFVDQILEVRIFPRSTTSFTSLRFRDLLSCMNWVLRTGIAPCRIS